MLWQGRRESDNVEDERGSGGGGGRLVLGGGIGTVILVVAYLLLGGDPQALFNSQQAQLPQNAQYDTQAPHDEASKFVAVVLADTEDAWHAVFRQMGREYQEPKLVLFTDQTRSGCGFASGATGPFYCPEDRRVYIDFLGLAAAASAPLIIRFSVAMRPCSARKVRRNNEDFVLQFLITYVSQNCNEPENEV